ncbi:T6SS immunity protein Tdi1 domain-containing protein, partial [Nocardia seriolae]|uniref:T6SS immunity protein Tdi1 domain-containing protein n=2 Tax=Nocardia seriolae TaxID=37332 RepID=UPI000D263B19
VQIPTTPTTPSPTLPLPTPRPPTHLNTSVVAVLGPDQVYIPTPYPFLGGTKAPETYEIGDVWVFLDIVAQMLTPEQSPTPEQNTPKRRWPWSRRR